MVHESVLEAIHDDSSDGGEDEGYDDDGELQSGFQAMDITSSTPPEHQKSEPSGAVAVAGATKKKKKKKKRKGDNRRRQQQNQPFCIEKFVVQTCRQIDETKYPLFREAVDRIGVDTMRALLNQVDAIEKCGGQMTADGLRRRSAGGVLWSLLRDQVGPGLYKEIMKEGNRKHIEQQKARLKEKEKERGNGKRQHSAEVDEDERQQSSKRRRTDAHRRSVSRDRVPMKAGLREEVDNVRAPAALQDAWVQGLKKHSSETILNPKPSEAKGLTKKPISERLRMTVSYGDLAEDGEIATDSPIRGVTEIEQVALNESLEEEGEIKDDGEIAD